MLRSLKDCKRTMHSEQRERSAHCPTLLKCPNLELSGGDGAEYSLQVASSLILQLFLSFKLKKVFCSRGKIKDDMFVSPPLVPHVSASRHFVVISRKKNYILFLHTSVCFVCLKNPLFDFYLCLLFIFSLSLKFDITRGLASRHFVC